MTGLHDAGLTCHIAQLEDDIVASLRSAFPKQVVATVQSHPGEFDAESVKRYALRANALVLTTDGGETARRGGVLHRTNMYSLFVITKGRSPRTRHRAMSLIVEGTLKLLLGGSAWTTSECVQNPTSVSDKNFFSDDIDDLGMALWALRWDQILEIPYTEGIELLPNFRTLYASYLRVGEDDPTDTIAEQEIELNTE